MKRRGREINIFSMSALDLFASGMGAFILLAVMALPFFLNTGDFLERIETVKAELEEARRQRDEARRQRDRAESQRDQAERRLVDTTELSRQRREAERQRDEAERQQKEAERQRGEAELQQREAELKHNEAARQIQEARRKLDAATRRAGELEMTKEQAALATARTFAVTGGQRVSAVMAWRGQGKPEPFLRELARAGKGRFVDASGGESMIASVLLAILGI